MPYPPEHKAETRARIIESARVMFNRHGFERVSIDDVMKEAGLTRGGFYHHFRSKDELYAEAVQSFSKCNPLGKYVASRKVPLEPKQLARLLVNAYLSDEIFQDIDQQCPVIALPSDVARAGLKPRAAYTQIMRNMLRVFRGAFPASNPSAETKAQLVLNLCVGGMVMARTTDDPELRRSLRATARAEALSLLETPGPVRRAGRGGRATVRAP